MDIKGFLIECWKAVELYNSGKIDSKPWEQLEELKTAVNLANYKADISGPIRNIISALKKMFKGDRYQELYFLKRNLSYNDGNSDTKLLYCFRLALIALTYASLGKKDLSFSAQEESGKVLPNKEQPCYSINFLACAFADLHWVVSGVTCDFPVDFIRANIAAEYLDPLLSASGIITYPYKVSWVANALMRTCAVAHYLDKVTLQPDGRLPQDLNQGRKLLDDYNTYLGPGIDPVEVIASDLGSAQQAASAAYFKTYRSSNTDILKTMETTEARRLAFINKPSQFAAKDNTKDQSLFYVLRRWNSFTPIVPDEEGRQKIYRGGGYFIWNQGQGTVVDPGFRFIRNFADAGGRVTDIDNIVITHAHNDHTADLESIFTVLYQHNATIKNTLKEFGAYLPCLQLKYLDFLRTNKNATDEAKAQKLVSWIPVQGVSPEIGQEAFDWAQLRELLKDNDLAPGASVKYANVNTTAQDRAIMAMCLPKGESLKFDGLDDKNITSATAEDVLKKAGHAKKKVKVYANLGTLRKFNAIIDPDSQYIDYIGDVFVIHLGQTYPLAVADKDGKNELTMIVHKAYHNEVVTKNFATGLEFVFSKNLNTPRSRVLITSDTSLCWTFKAAPVKTAGLGATDTDYTGRQNLQYTANEVIQGYPKSSTTTHDLLLPHIGSIKDYEVSPPSFNPKNFIYKNHLGIIGVSQVIASFNPDVALVTEFGEEMTDVIKLSMDMVRRGVRGVHTLKTPTQEPQLKTNILPADIGLALDMDAWKYFQAKSDGSGAWTGDSQAGIGAADLKADYAEQKTFPVTYKDKTK